MNVERKMQEKLNSLEERVKKLEDALLSSATADVHVSKRKKSSAKEFLMTMNLKAETQKVLVLGFFLEHVEDMGSFNTSDLERVFRAAKEKLPKNMNDAVNKNIARGLIMEAESKKDAKKAWCLTSTGENVVINELKK